jgi:tetratricopeptide (TPR) repeat protein
MRAHVFTDPALAEQAGRFAWLSIDVENAANEKFLATFPWKAVPTFLVIDPRSEQVVYKWLGAVDRPQLQTRLAESLTSFGSPPHSPAEQALAEAERLNGSDREVEAAAAYQKALQLGGDDWPARSRVTESMVLALAMSGDHQACVDSALAAVGTLPRSASFANVASTGLTCALELDPSNSARAKSIGQLELMVREASAIPGLLGDDRSGLFASLLDARKDAGDETGVKALALEWLDFLEQATKGAASAEERAAYDSHRVAAALAAGDPARVLPALQQSARELPDDYNPSARLALLLRELGRYDDALAASDRALTLAYGPRKLALFETRASIYERRNDTAAAQQTYHDAIAYARTLPASPRLDRAISRLEQKLR